MMKIVGGALFRDGKLLVVKRTPQRVLWPGKWEIPGGRVEGQETDHQALEREFWEETRIKIEVLHHSHKYHYMYADQDAVENDYVVKETSRNVIVIDPEEHTEFKWISRDELEALEVSPDMRLSIEKCFDIHSGL